LQAFLKLIYLIFSLLSSTTIKSSGRQRGSREDGDKSRGDERTKEMKSRYMKNGIRNTYFEWMQKLVTGLKLLNCTQRNRSNFLHPANT
jgi:hypothetical protein